MEYIWNEIDSDLGNKQLDAFDLMKYFVLGSDV